jgi:GT2 family glycosyltransferase
MSAPEVSILIVNYRCRDYLARALRSVFAQLPAGGFEVLVVDNASGDDSVAQARALGLPVRWFELKENVGFARGNNLAAEQARGRQLLLLNPDVELTADCVTPMARYLDARPDVGLVGCHHTDRWGGWQVSFGHLPTLAAEYRFALLRRRLADRYFFPEDTPEPVEVGWLAGSCILFPAALYRELGLFDPNYFLNDEDIDLARRVRRSGRRVMYHPARGLIHFGGISKEQTRTRLKEHFNSRRYYYRKHVGRLGVLAFLAAWGLYRLRDRVSLGLGRHRPKAAG